MILKCMCMKPKTRKIVFEIVKALVYALCGYFGIPMVD